MVVGGVLLAAVPVLLPLVALLGSPGSALPGLPAYHYQPLPGDAYGYYYCAREIQATLGRDAAAFGAAIVVALAVLLIGWRLSGWKAWVAVSWAAALPAAVLAQGVRFTGAPQIGWPLVWSIALAPARLGGSNMSLSVVFGIGLALSLAFNVATVVATYALGRRAGLGTRVAFAGAALLSVWPLLSLLAGSGAARNGTWQIDLGLSLYTEPLSTALVVVSLAVLVDRKADVRLVAVAGGLLGLATLVRVSNALVIVCLLAGLVVGRDLRRACILALASAAWAPAVLLFWPKGYPKLKPPVFPAHPFELAYAATAWTHSSLWHPAVLVALVPLALLGIARGSRSAAALLWSVVAVTVAFYSFYELTPLHPRFLFVVLPVVILYWTSGAAVLLSAGRALYDRAV